MNFSRPCRFAPFLLVFLISFLAADSARAENPKGYTAHLGLNIADVSMDSATSTGSIAGYDLGASFEQMFAPDFYFVPGLQIMQRGFAFDVGLTQLTLRLTYLELPLLFQARFQGAPALTPFFTAGPVVGMKLGTSCSVDVGTCAPSYDTDRVNSMHLGLDIGGGAIFALDGESGAALIGQLRYHLGLTRVASGLPDPRHRGLLLEAGYRF